MSWRPSAPLQQLQARARLLAGIRAFFVERGVMEVETPALSHFGVTDPHLHSLALSCNADACFLHTSPEFPMKRLLAAGSGPIYQICRVFRDGEQGRLHNPEFSLLEWYRPGFSLPRLMDEMQALIEKLAGRELPAKRLSYADLFAEYLGLDPLRADIEELKTAAMQHGQEQLAQLDLPDKDAWLDLLLSHCIEPRLPTDALVYVYDYPASQAALARLSADDPRVAARFELYAGGMELANGFHELSDAAEQRRRFRQETRKREQLGLPAVPMDEHLLQALAAGLPDCSGVALGLDRLLMWLTGVDHIDQVLAFPFDRA